MISLPLEDYITQEVIWYVDWEVDGHIEPHVSDAIDDFMPWGVNSIITNSVEGAVLDAECATLHCFLSGIENE